MINVIYPFRDRTPERLLESVESLRNSSSIDFYATVVDYGSEDTIKEKLQALCAKNKIELIRCESQGLPWSRAHALNIGVAKTRGKYVVTTDIDMIFEGDILGLCLKLIKAETKIHCQPYWLSPSGNKKRAVPGDNGQLGGFQFIQKDTFFENGGFCESIFYWGFEDVEWHYRLTNRGYRTIWIEDDVKMYHRWHPLSYGVYDKRPMSSVCDSYKAILRGQTHQHEQSAPFGKLMLKKDRPILGFIREETPYLFEIKNGKYFQRFSEFVEKSVEQKYIKVILGCRYGMKYPGRNAKHFAKLFNLIDRHIGHRFGLSLQVKMNNNFDFFYISIDVLKEAGLIDYFINDEMDSVYLLFK